MIAFNTAAVDDDAQNDEAQDRGDLDDAEDELDLTVSAHAKDLDDNQERQEGANPDADIVFVPVGNGDARSRDFKGQHREPPNGVVPAHRKSPSSVAG
jgi:hypothetical protein